VQAAVAAGLRGAFRLGRGDASGLGLIEATPEGALRSFWAAAICLPAFLALRLLSWSTAGEPTGGVARPLAAELIGYAAAWAGFALASRPVAEVFGRRNRWPQFLAAWNYANVVQYLVLLALTVPAALGLPGWLANGLGLAAVGYALWLEWFVARSALQLGGGQAVALVALDLVIGLFVHGLVAMLSGG
jgi:hypothetical protein